jgi:hypothetical protein
MLSLVFTLSRSVHYSLMKESVTRSGQSLRPVLRSDRARQGITPSMCRRLGILVTVEAVLGVLLAVTINVATGGSLPDALSPLRPWAWPLVAVLGVLAVAVPLGRFVIERTRSPGGRYSAFHRDRQRGRILAALAQRWVEGTLTPSHAVTPKIGVTLAQRADAVDPPADLLAPPEPLGPAEVGIREVFERLDGAPVSSTCLAGRRRDAARSRL